LPQSPAILGLVSPFIVTPPDGIFRVEFADNDTIVLTSASGGKTKYDLTGNYVPVLKNSH
jgi:hypothetical protein